MGYGGLYLPPQYQLNQLNYNPNANLLQAVIASRNNYATTNRPGFFYMAPPANYFQPPKYSFNQYGQYNQFPQYNHYNPFQTSPIWIIAVPASSTQATTTPSTISSTQTPTIVPLYTAPTTPTPFTSAPVTTPLPTTSPSTTTTSTMGPIRLMDGSPPPPPMTEMAGASMPDISAVPRALGVVPLASTAIPSS